MTYNEKLRDPRWQRRRLEVLSRDKFTCTLCGDKDTELHIHHKYYTDKVEPWEYKDEALQTLCKYCHTATEDLKSATLIPIITAKFTSGEEIIVSCIVKVSSGEKAIAILHYTAGELIRYEAVPVNRFEQLKALIALSEKL